MSYLEMALRALAESGAASPAVPESPCLTSEPIKATPALPVNVENSTPTLAPCASPQCARCYDVGEGRKIHPPTCGRDYLEWLKKWRAKAGCNEDSKETDLGACANRGPPADDPRGG
jgi:hypothetical protein